VSAQRDASYVRCSNEMKRSQQLRYCLLCSMCHRMYDANRADR
jgi:hypothetical protein